MKKDRAGAIWGYLDPRKAEEITREITRQQEDAISPSTLEKKEPQGKRYQRHGKMPIASRAKKPPAM